MRSTRSGQSLSSLWLSLCILIAASLIGCTTSAVHREGTVYNCDDEDHIRWAWTDYDDPNLIVAQGDSQSYSLLACAAQQNNKTLVKDLIAAGADINRRDLQGAVPLSGLTSPDMTQFLIEQGADITVRDRSGATPLFKVVQNPYLDDATRLALIETYLAAGADAKTQNANGDTLLHMTTNPWVAQLLIDQGALVDVQNKSGSTPLHAYYAYENDMGVARVLLEQGADVNAQDHHGNTPLHYIACNLENCNRPDAEAEFLIAFGADPTLKNKQGQSAQELAITQNRLELVKLFGR
ncbi:MAG: ankyrin repeat domain-containing protein [Cyanobacteria bacterium P01_G01_bin.38]